MAYGGLRGAVGFSLVVMLGDVIDKETAQVFVTCTLFIVLFTVFVQVSGDWRSSWISHSKTSVNLFMYSQASQQTAMQNRCTYF